MNQKRDQPDNGDAETLTWATPEDLRKAITCAHGRRVGQICPHCGHVVGYPDADEEAG